MAIPYYFKMLNTSNAGWDEAERSTSVVKTLFYMVLPLSLLPSLMILYAGFTYGANYFSAATDVTWMTSAAVFLIAELLTLPLMAFALKSVAQTRGIHTEYRHAFAVVSVSAVPMWLSSLALFVTVPLFVIAAGLLGLIVSIYLTYHGTKGLLYKHEELEVAAITHTTLSLGVVTWVFLMTLILIPLMW